MHIGGDIVGLNTPDIVGFGSITAATFFGDGAGLSNTGAQMTTPATGEHRVVLTDITSGTMIRGYTDSTLKFNLGDDNLISTKFTGNLTGNDTGNVTGNVTGNLTGTASQVNISNGVNNRVLTAASSNTINAEANLTFSLNVTGPSN